MCVLVDLQALKCYVVIFMLTVSLFKKSMASFGKKKTGINSLLLERIEAE